ncbi:hypothetical protein H0H93_011960, partial [Arthromyces matolae]
PNKAISPNDWIDTISNNLDYKSKELMRDFLHQLPQNFTADATMVSKSKCTQRTTAENLPRSIHPKPSSCHFRRRFRTNRRNANTCLVEQALRSRKQPLRASDNATPVASSSTTPCKLPKTLNRPTYCEVTNKALAAAEPHFNEIPAAYARDALAHFGVTALRSLSHVSTSPFPSDKLPSEVEVTVAPTEGLVPINPTHMLAIFAPNSSQKRKAVLYPGHAPFLAAHCSRLSPFSPYNTDASPAGTPFKVPVQPICLPNPATYPCLSTYIYTRKAEPLLSSIMPLPLPSNLLDAKASVDKRRQLVSSYAYQIASTYTIQFILQHVAFVHGLWQNTCALGIFDDGLWEVIDVAWQILLTAIALGTGNAQPAP